MLSCLYAISLNANTQKKHSFFQALKDTGLTLLTLIEPAWFKRCFLIMCCDSKCSGSSHLPIPEVYR